MSLFSLQTGFCITFSAVPKTNRPKYEVKTHFDCVQSYAKLELDDMTKKIKLKMS